MPRHSNDIVYTYVTHSIIVYHYAAAYLMHFMGRQQHIYYYIVILLHIAYTGTSKRWRYEGLVISGRKRLI